MYGVRVYIILIANPIDSNHNKFDEVRDNDE